MINLIYIFCINIISIFIYKLLFTYSNTRINLKKLKNQAIKLKMIINLFPVFDPSTRIYNISFNWFSTTQDDLDGDKGRMGDSKERLIFSQRIIGTGKLILDGASNVISVRGQILWHTWVPAATDWVLVDLVWMPRSWA